MEQRGSWQIGQAAEAVGLDPEDASRGIDYLAALGLVEFPVADSPEFVLLGSQVAAMRLINEAERELAANLEQMATARAGLAEILSSFMPLNFWSPGPVAVEMLTDLRSVGVYLNKATELAREQILTMHPAPAPAPPQTAESADRTRALVDRNLDLRTIYQQSLASVPRIAKHLDEVRLSGYEVRLSPTVPFRMIIFDRRRVIIPIDPNNGKAGAMAIEGEALVRALISVFEYCWQHSSYEGSGTIEAELSLGPQEQAVLRMLATGATDETIARNLTVSLRTVNRVVCRIMKAIGADSRFQAGMIAARLGLIH
ncbi:LuxR C-terminal-related transcriptional regulator [Kitasatospora sp. NPDC096147]|uniref:helix-turn-helix transcriptional regulator n=1 Tax=Kitasatospora sp. NPDC096147 TaxID=3364093 RepID=UPI00382F186C